MTRVNLLLAYVLGAGAMLGVGVTHVAHRLVFDDLQQTSTPLVVAVGSLAAGVALAALALRERRRAARILHLSVG